ncbi:hypothetical protein PR202_ga14852 [Eleusine coracana subsp. coracana]|uniref:Uncharacterized protein n=1 Tax=Eleusine coracana subsp. coracana TaxID=191504 RepID=A0AAV5CIN1_ELECO|nr:hypothetical protein PR202_ga14852 [Eleusine coracana subsp. coracana]
MIVNAHCSGMAFALVNVKLVLAILLFHFDWELPRGMEPVDLDMTEEIGGHCPAAPRAHASSCRGSALTS